MKRYIRDRAMKRKRSIGVFFAVVLTIGFFIGMPISPDAMAEKFPAKTVNLIISHGAGGSTDRPARLIQPFLQKELGVPVVIINKTGAGGNIARAHVYGLKPDGYNLLVTQQPSLSCGAIVSGRFDPLKFVPVYNISGKQWTGMAVPYNSPIKTLPELIKASQIKEMTTNGSGIGTNSWLIHVFLNRAGGKFRYVPYTGSSAASMALAGGQVESGCATYTNHLPMQQKKKVRLIAVFGKVRGEFAPDVPTALEQGVDVEIDQLTSVYAPPGLPKEKLDILANAFEKAAHNPEFIKMAKKAKVSLDLMGPEDLRKRLIKVNDLILGIAPILKEAKKK